VVASQSEKLKLLVEDKNNVFNSDRGKASYQTRNSNFDPATGLQPSNLVMVTNVAAVPVPAAAWLFGSGLLGLIGVARRKKTA